MTLLPVNALRKIDAHEFEREEHEHYVEPHWCSERLFAVEPFVQEIWDPCCGFGRIPEAARTFHHAAMGTDLIDRGYERLVWTEDFLSSTHRRPNIVCNPPFNIFKEFALKALQQADHKVAMIWLLTPRPPMPPGHVITASGKLGGGKQDFCWLIWERGHIGPATISWLHRDPVEPHACKKDA